MFIFLLLSLIFMCIDWLSGITIAIAHHAAATGPGGGTRPPWGGGGVRMLGGVVS